MKRSRSLIAQACLLTAATLPMSIPAMAQDSDDTTLETVVVTAQKHAELLSKAPVAISAVSQQGLDKLNINTAQDLVSTVPNLQTSVNGYSTQFQIRGIGNNSGSYSVVATQIDGVYQANSGTLNTGLYDVARIEVARGPQGTVYGRNATAGVVNILTNDPEKEFHVFGDIAYGNYNDLTTRAVVNVPVTDDLAMRASFVRETNDGYYPSGAAANKYNSKDIMSGQFTVLANLTDNLTWRLAVEHSENTGTLRYLFAVNYLTYPNADLTTGDLGTAVVKKARANMFNQESVTDNSLSIQENALRSRLTWDATDEFSITYLAGLSSYVDNGNSAATGVYWQFGKAQETQSMSHELDFNYNTSKLKAVAGLYLYWDNNTGYGGIRIGNTVPYPLSTYVSTSVTPLNNAVGDEPSSYGLIDLAQDTKKNGNQSEAVFGQVTYSVQDDLRLTAGIRYTKDWHNVDMLQTVCAFGTAVITSSSATCTIPYGSATETIQATKSSNVSWRLGADYDLNDNQLLYASVSTGYRAGGVSGNSQLPTEYLTYKPERVTNYEAGWKAELLNRSLGLSITAFNMDYTNMQVSAIEHDLDDNPAQVTINAAKARIKGAEFEWTWRITGADTLTGYATYLDARFSSFADAVNSTVNPDGIYNTYAVAKYGFATLSTNVAYNFTGNYLPNAPQESLRVAYSHVFDLGDAGTFTPSLQVYWQDAMYSDFANAAQSVHKPYTKSDLVLTYVSASERLSVEAFIHNLENRTTWEVLNAKWDDTQGTRNPPRTYGIRVGYKLY